MAESLAQLQRRFGRHLRDPEHQPVPAEVDPIRMAIYRELFFNNIQSLLRANFPILHATLGEADWQSLVRAFCREHRAQTPLFSEIGQEFIAFLDSDTAPAQPPWLTELAHYEWIELALQIADDPLPAHVADADLLDGTPVLSPYCRALAYQWPVHRISADHRPDTPPAQPTLLLARRQTDGSIVFSELSPLLFRLFELLDCQPVPSGRQLLLQLAEESGSVASSAFIAEGMAMLQRLRAQACLLGAAPPAAR